MNEKIKVPYSWKKISAYSIVEPAGIMLGEIKKTKKEVEIYGNPHGMFHIAKIEIKVLKII